MEKRNITKKGVRYKQKFYWNDFMKEHQQKQVLIEPVDGITLGIYLSGYLIGFATKVGTKERRCRACGCTWNNGCFTGCWWVEEDLCSECVDKEN